MQVLKGILQSIRFVDEKVCFRNYTNINNPNSSVVIKNKNNGSPECLILIIFKGELLYNDGNKKNIILNENELIFFKPLEKINIKTIPNKFTEYCVVSFSSKVFSKDEETLLRVFNYEDGKNILKLNKIENGENILNLFNDSKRYLGLNLKVGHFIALLKLLLSELCIAFDKNAPQIAEKYSQEYDSKVYSYITQNFNKNLSINEVAEKFYISPSYINKICKKFYSLPYRQMIIDIKMWYARNLMSKISGITLNKVASMCGYNEYSAFYKAYLNYFGIKPKDDYKLYLQTGSFYNKFINE